MRWGSVACDEVGEKGRALEGMVRMLDFHLTAVGCFDGF